ncbi:hypothetical protein [Puia dinghuensis]|uniref:PepSY domain-containing protein n=1 Tax=Puia dinghuensis TaxID=1792502 RepID=A0A8J2UKF2_9BACT|nr:hypothetical protein [Puia dinghuensis]GGB25227.1 hypothetical protein GCM10011511_56490 [Puia dinghuensis]
METIFFKLLLSGLLLAGTAGVASAQTTSAPTTSTPTIREFFDKKGRHVGTIAYYGEKELPAEIRAIVKPSYYDYAILTVEEVRASGKTAWLIDMQDATHVKTVKVVDGEMEEVSSLRRW